jgi:hypothetical protein
MIEVKVKDQRDMGKRGAFRHVVRACLKLTGLVFRRRHDALLHRRFSTIIA